MYASNNKKEFVINKDESLDDIPSFDDSITHAIIINFKAGDKKVIGSCGMEYAKLLYNEYKNMINNLGFPADSVVMQSL